MMLTAVMLALNLGILAYALPSTLGSTQNASLPLPLVVWHGLGEFFPCPLSIFKT